MAYGMSALLMAQRSTSQGAEEALIRDLNPCARRFMSSLAVTRQFWIIEKGMGRPRLHSEDCRPCGGRANSGRMSHLKLHHPGAREPSSWRARSRSVGMSWITHPGSPIHITSNTPSARGLIAHHSQLVLRSALPVL